MMECPICSETFKDGRGLHGHLRFKEGLQGEELDEVYERAKEMEKAREAEEASSKSEALPLYANHSETVRLAMRAVHAFKKAYENKSQVSLSLKAVEVAKPVSMDDRFEEAWKKLNWAFREEAAAAEQEVQSAKIKVQDAVRMLASKMNGD